MRLLNRICEASRQLEAFNLLRRDVNRRFRATQEWQVNENIKVKIGEGIILLAFDYYTQTYKVKFENVKEPQIIPMLNFPDIFVEVYL